jgi:hypothetical protein
VWAPISTKLKRRGNVVRAAARQRLNLLLWRLRGPRRRAGQLMRSPLIPIARALAVAACIVIVFVVAETRLAELVRITDIQAGTTLLSAIVGSLSSILGILVALILVTFELSRQSYSHHAFRLVFGHPRFLELVTWYLTTILLSLYVLLSLSPPLSLRSNALMMASLVTATISLVILAPSCYAVVRRPHAKSQITTLAAAIGWDAISELGRFRSPRAPADEVAALEENPIFILGELGIRTIRQRDRITPRLILGEFGNRLLELLNAAGNSSLGPRRQIIESFLVGVRPVATVAIEEGAVETVASAFGFYERVHRFAAEKQLAWHELIELDELADELIALTIKNDLDVVLRNANYTLVRVALGHLRHNVPAEEALWLLQVRAGRDIHALPDRDKTKDADAFNQWRHISDTYTRCIAEGGTRAVVARRRDAVIASFSALQHLRSEITDLPLGPLQKEDLTFSICTKARHLIASAARDGIYDALMLGLSPFNSFALDRSNGERADKTLLMQWAATLLEVSAAGRLEGFELNDLGTCGRGLASEVSQQMFPRQAMLLIAETFDRLRRDIEAKGGPNAKRLYLELREQVLSLQQWLKQANATVLEIDSKIAEVLANFPSYEAFRTELRMQEVRWPSNSEPTQQ